MRGPVERLIRNDRYQVFLMTSPAPLPFSFAAHPWLVVNAKGVISWYGVGNQRVRMTDQPLFGNHFCVGNGCVGFVHKDGHSFGKGSIILSSFPKYLWRGRVRSGVEGGESSLAARMTSFIQASPSTYPYRDHYELLGPNSNTYVEWILEQFPESHMSLPWNALGKGYLA